jgi:hypothetical protein
MKSLELLTELEAIPIDEKYSALSNSKMLELLHNRQIADCFIEAGVATEIGLLALFESRNIPDHYFEAYKASFSNSDMSLYEHFQKMLENGDRSVLGFVNNFKGKVFEFELLNKLKELYPSYDFSIALDPTQPIWDIQAINSEGVTDFFVQAKMWDEGSASILQRIMEANPDILYATSNEIRDKVLENAPELADQFLPVDFSNYDFTEGVKENLETLVGNLGIDVPDSLGDVLPYVGEIVLGIRLILDLIEVQKSFANISATDKAKLSGVKAIVLFSRFGITSTCAAIGSVAGGLIGPLGAPVGGILGAIISSKLNKKLKPKMLELALKLLNLKEEDMFYYNNKKKIDKLALSFRSASI